VNNIVILFHLVNGSCSSIYWISIWWHQQSIPIDE